MLKEKLMEVIEAMTTDEKVTLNNLYCESVLAYDGMIYGMEMFNDLMGDRSPEDIAMCIHFGNFNPMHAYFKFDAYANLESIHEWDIDDYIFADEIADEIIAKEYAFENDDIQAILDEQAANAIIKAYEQI